MSLKDNVNYVKDEISSEEKFLESFVKVERFYKKNKIVIISVVVIIIALVIGFFVTKSIQESNKIEANIALNKVLDNPKDNEALNILKDKNKNLYEIAQYLNSKKEGKVIDVDVKFLKDLTAYQKALEENSAEKLNSVSMQNDFLLKEFAIFNKAVILTENGKYKEAKNTLKMIQSDSKVNDLVNILKHYLATK
ncbi:tetratricopeptide repeat protein [Halarcobacter sp.]|uniref:tetratricopeptide repeat protein n=1 Tax=Halarcobacter sp. TaxID=2321133 RepID=UPI002AA61401|nr:tetratricopeptide repeat protein [Halarcobacter sp.]